MDPDLRSFCVALVADDYVNPRPGGWDGLEVLTELGWGVIQLPSPDYPPDVAGPLLEQVAEQTAEFCHHDYTVVVVGSYPRLEEALTEAGIGGLPTCRPRDPVDLERFLLDARPLSSPSSLRPPSG